MRVNFIKRKCCLSLKSPKQTQPSSRRQWIFTLPRENRHATKAFARCIMGSWSGKKLRFTYAETLYIIWQNREILKYEIPKWLIMPGAHSSNFQLKCNDAGTNKRLCFPITCFIFRGANKILQFSNIGIIRHNELKFIHSLCHMLEIV